MLLRDKKAIITGATAGIGKAIAKLFVENGADVAIIGTNIERAKETLAELEKIKVKESQKIIFEMVNVANTQEIEISFTKILQLFGRVDILINNAGITKDNLLIRMPEEDWDRVIDVNLKSVYNTCKAIARPMMKAKKGKIINISSVIGLTGNAGQINYAASKAGIIGLTKSLAKELASRNINVNCIAPGFIKTKMTEALPEEVKKELLEKIPLKRLGEPEDVAQLVLFLAGNMSDYITGQTITIDGGMII